MITELCSVICAMKREEIFSSIAVLAAFGAVLGWLVVPGLADLALQGFVGALGLFFITKRLQNAKMWHVLPHTHSPELGLLTFAFYLLIGATGNLSSPLLPLSFIHTFVVVFTAGPYTAIVTAASAFVFHWYQAPAIGMSEIVSLSIIPLLLVYFLFARRQYDALKQEENQLIAETVALDLTSSRLESVLTALEQRVHPKFESIRTELLKLSTKNDQLVAIQEKINSLAAELKSLIDTYKK